MFRTLTVHVLSLLAVIGYFSIATTVHAQNLRPWTVQSVNGDVRHSVNGSASQTLEQGASIGVGSKISTGRGARVVLARGTESITMSPKSEIAIPPATGNMLTRIVQNLGTLLLKVEKRPEQHFEVKTPYLAAVVKGTSFTVSVDQRGSAVHVVSGLVQVNDLISGQTGLVQPGRTGVVTSQPGGGLQISGGKANTDNKQAAAKTEKKAATAADAKADRQNTTPAKSKAKGSKTLNTGKSRASKSAAVKTGPKGPAITAALGVAKVNISAVTNGFMKSDNGQRGNKGGASGKTDFSSVSIGSGNIDIGNTDGNSGGGNAFGLSTINPGGGNNAGGNGTGNGNPGGGNNAGGNGNGNGNPGGGNNAGGNGNGNGNPGGGNNAGGNGNGNPGGNGNGNGNGSS